MKFLTKEEYEKQEPTRIFTESVRIAVDQIPNQRGDRLRFMAYQLVRRADREGYRVIPEYVKIMEDCAPEGPGYKDYEGRLLTKLQASPDQYLSYFAPFMSAVMCRSDALECRAEAADKVIGAQKLVLDLQKARIARLETWRGFLYHQWDRLTGWCISWR